MRPANALQARESPEAGREDPHRPPDPPCWQLAARRCGRWFLSHGRLFINFVSSLVGPIAAPGW